MYVTYVNHSGVAVRWKGAMLVFDYYQGKIPEVSKETPVIVFVSHSHADHFRLKIFEWQNVYTNIDYVISDDVSLKQKGDNIHRIGPNQESNVSGFDIQTLKSTDEGVAFIVTKDGESIYHAGDLNWWHWEGESDAFNTFQRVKYKAAIDKIEGKEFSLACLPLDGRLEDSYSTGFKYFMEHTNTNNALPIHMWGDFGVIDRIKADPQASSYAGRILNVTHDGQEFEVS
ncbi:MAG: MBL fold metallo-hydrolase [Lachnospiraceae bacterium]|jgi:L-ascorbate metabolism protein UlaG (beta-lactamase superfamily)|nr:MBL fold metallo-hydrolase [Lachnospiraceae bacterium]